VSEVADVSEEKSKAQPTPASGWVEFEMFRKNAELLTGAGPGCYRESSQNASWCVGDVGT